MTHVRLACVMAVGLFATGALPRANPVVDRTVHGQQPAAVPVISAPDLMDRSFEAAYSLDHNEALSLARQAVAQAPNDPDAHRALASILWLNILFRRGAVTVDHFLGGLTKSVGSLPKVPPDLAAEFHKELNTAIRLGQARLAHSPQDLDARYGLATSYGLEAAYTAAIDNSLMSAFMTAKHAYDDAEAVLARDPNRGEAAIIVGTYRYVVATMALPSRWMAYVVGFGGGKAKGIALIEGALKDREAHADAALALILIYSREGRHDDVVKLLRELEKEYPRNRLFVLEHGSADIRGGHAEEAETVLSAGLEQFEHDPREKLPGEAALWFYKRGMARVLLHRLPDARRDLDTALESSPLDWVRGRIHLELGKTDDLEGKRPDALAEYRQARSIASVNNDPLAEAEAARLEHRPYARETP